MSDRQKVLAVLRAARLDVVRHWTERGGYCASVVIVFANQSLPGEDVTVAAHAALLRSVGIPVPTGQHAMCHAVYAWDDAQTSVYPVVAAFDRAIASLEPEPTPTADVPTADVVSSLLNGNAADEIVGRRIVLRHPELREVAAGMGG